MTDKQIIIDGVDVARCRLYDYGICDSEQVENLNCEQNSDCYYKQLKRKEQECEELDKELHKNFEEKDKLHLIIDRLLEASGYDTNTASAEDFEDVYENIRYEKQQLDQLKVELEAYKMEADEGKEINAELKAEVKSKTEYIQEQRKIIDQYSKEIEMYKKCQGKRASKREEELKAENEELKEQLELNTANAVVIDMAQRLYNYKQAIKRIKEILLFNIEELEECLYNDIDKQILKICDEVTE